MVSLTGRVNRYRRYADTLTAHGRHADAKVMSELAHDLTTYQAVTVFNPARDRAFAWNAARDVDGGTLMGLWVRAFWSQLATGGDIGREDETREGETVPLEVPVTEPAAPTPVEEPAPA